MTNITTATANHYQSPFDSIRRFDEHGNEYWMARELMKLLGYKTWQKFCDAIDRAKSTCLLNGELEANHINHLPGSVHFTYIKGSATSKGRFGDDYQLSRRAVELIAASVGDCKRLSAKRSPVTERQVQSNLAAQLEGITEIQVICGRIDILTTTEIIEVKKVTHWKEALGQILVYGDYYPSHIKRIHLYGETQESFLDMVRSHCIKRGVEVTWEA